MAGLLPDEQPQGYGLLRDLFRGGARMIWRKPLAGSRRLNWSRAADGHFRVAVFFGTD